VAAPPPSPATTPQSQSHSPPSGGGAAGEPGPRQSFSGEFWHLFFLELGLGFVVGCVVSLTIERYMDYQKRRELLEQEQEIKTDVFEALFGTALPKPLIQEMYEAIFVPKFVRENFRITFTFRPLTDAEEEQFRPADTGPPAEGLLVIQQVVSFRAQNTTNQRVDYNAEPGEYMLVEHPAFPTPFREYRMSCGLDEQHLQGDDIVAASRRNRRPEDGDIWHGLGRLTLKVPPGGHVDVCSVVEEVCRYADTKTLRTTQPADGIGLTVVIKDRRLYETLEFGVDQAHRMNLARLDSSELKASMTYQWELPYPILPSQGVMLHWRPKD
jgi:hypothetical protein